MDHVGTGSFRIHMYAPNRWLKRYGLFFDRFEIVDLNDCLEQHRTTPYGKIDTIEECDWLIEHGLLSHPQDMETSPYLSPLASPNVQLIDQAIRALAMRDYPLGRAFYEATGDKECEIPSSMLPLIWERNTIANQMAALWARRSAIVMRETGRAVATSLESLPPNMTPSVDAPVCQQDLLRFVMTEIPVPGRRVPWQEIIAFRLEADSQERLRELRLWIAATSRGGVGAAEAQDRIAGAIADYRRHVESLGLECEMARWEALVITSSVTRDDLVTRWLDPDLARPIGLASLSTVGLAAERHAPGRELSYIVKVQDAF